MDENLVWASINFNADLMGCGVIKTNNGGSSWQEHEINSAASITCIHPRSADVAYLGILDGANIGKLIKTTNGGATWNVQSTAYGHTGSWIDYIHFYDEDNGFTFGDPVGGYLEMYTTTNGGINWIAVPTSNIPPALVNEYPRNTAVGLVGDIIWIPVVKLNGDQFRIFKSTDRGLSWAISSQFTFFPSTLAPSSIAFKNQSEGILIASDFNNYKLLKTTDGGNTWPEISFPLSIDPIFICDIPGTSQGYLVSAPFINKGSAYTLDGGNSWQMIEDNLDLCLPKCNSLNSGWAISYGSPSIYKWSGISAVEDDSPLPTEFALEQNYPNPFNPSTIIRYSIPQTSKVVIKVYDILGNEVATLMDEEKPVGTYELTWNAVNIPSGVFFYQLKAGEFTSMKKMILLK